METPTPAAPASEDKLRNLPPEARASFARFRTTRATADLDPVIFAILTDFSPRKPVPPLATLPGGTRLMEDLGFDSLAITEVVFFTEDLLGVTISNEEIVQIGTLEQLRTFIHGKAGVAAAA